jgi:hypothetical protein
MKIESKKIFIVGNREFDNREDAVRFAEFADYSEEIEGYLSAVGLTGALDRGGLTNRTRIVNILVDFLRWQDAQDAQQAAG